jgi:hypothetical protein
MGEKYLKLNKSYSKNGRINYMLDKRIKVFVIISKIAPPKYRQSLEVHADQIR